MVTRILEANRKCKKCCLRTNLQKWQLAAGTTKIVFVSRILVMSNHDDQTRSIASWQLPWKFQYMFTKTFPLFAISASLCAINNERHSHPHQPPHPPPPWHRRSSSLFYDQQRTSSTPPNPPPHPLKPNNVVFVYNQWTKVINSPPTFYNIFPPWQWRTPSEFYNQQRTSSTPPNPSTPPPKTEECRHAVFVYNQWTKVINSPPTFYNIFPPWQWRTPSEFYDQQRTSSTPPNPPPHPLKPNNVVFVYNQWTKVINSPPTFYNIFPPWHWRTPSEFYNQQRTSLTPPNPPPHSP